jgi:signal transduction histidine kinase
MLIWLQKMEIPELNSLVLGIGTDQKTLLDFMGDLHWSLDSILLLTYLLIALLGYYTMRSIGRIYERRLESRIQERTQKLNAAHKEVLNKTKLATIGQTASVLTHEMRNPLASIKLALSSLKGSGQYEDREVRRMDLVLGEVDRLDELLSETLDYVRPINRSTKPVDMGKLFTKLIKQQEPLLEEKGIRINHQSSSGVESIYVDQAQMHQALLNLLKNAIEASPTDGEISSSLRREGDELIFEILNGGEAPSEEVQQRAFEPFFTTKPKGTGLGLGLVKRVVEEHGGAVTMSGCTGTGTRLTLAFPLRELSEQA